MSAPVTIGRTSDKVLADKPRRKPWGKTPIKAVVSCKGCLWTWRPTTGFGHEACPKCGKVKSVRQRTHAPNLKAVNEWRRHRPGYATEKDREYRQRAVLLVGGGVVSCVRCGCDRPELLEINHINGGGGKELKRSGHKFYRDIALLKRATDDLELLCRPCNSVHYLELKHGDLPFRVVWEGDDGVA